MARDPDLLLFIDRPSASDLVNVDVTGAGFLKCSQRTRFRPGIVNLDPQDEASLLDLLLNLFGMMLGNRPCQ